MDRHAEIRPANRSGLTGNHFKTASDMNEKYALVTGASSGIGFQYARVLARKGYNLIVVSNEAEAIEQKGEELRKEFGVKVIPLMRDLGCQEAAKELYDYCHSENLEVEVLINNAGVYHDRDFLKDSEKFNSLILNLHVYTPAMLIWYFGQDMVQRHKGYILNMSSITARIAVQRLATYSATKAFLKNFTRSVHIELRGEGVNVTAVCPGAVATTLYNLKPSAIKAGLLAGYIITPEKLAEKGVKAMFRGRHRIIPGAWNHLLLLLIALIPTCALRLVRKWGIF